MLRKPKYTAEETSVGMQFVIPGTERIGNPVSYQPQYSADGRQLVIPGAERIALGELIRRKFDEPILPRCRQKPIIGMGLFGTNPRD